MFTNHESQRQYIKNKLDENFHTGRDERIYVDQLRTSGKKFMRSFTARISELRRLYRNEGLNIKCKIQNIGTVKNTYYRLEEII